MIAPARSAIHRSLDILLPAGGQYSTDSAVPSAYCFDGRTLIRAGLERRVQRMNDEATRGSDKDKR